MALWPGLFLSLVVYGMNMLGDALRDLPRPEVERRYRAIRPNVEGAEDLEAPTAANRIMLPIAASPQPHSSPAGEGKC